MEQVLPRIAALDRAIAALAETARYRTPVGWLRCFRGIDTLAAIVLLTELGDLSRFPHPRQLMAFLGLVPSEASSGAREQRGSITKAGNGHVRRLLVEACWHARHPPRLGGRLAQRSAGQPPAILREAWAAQQRLHRRDRHLVGHGKRPPVAVVALARELSAFLWAALTQGPAVQAA